MYISWAEHCSATGQFVSTTALHIRRGFCTLVLFIMPVVECLVFVLLSFQMDHYLLRKRGSYYHASCALLVCFHRARSMCWGMFGRHCPPYHQQPFWRMHRSTDRVCYLYIMRERVRLTIGTPVVHPGGTMSYTPLVGMAQLLHIHVLTCMSIHRFWNYNWQQL